MNLEEIPEENKNGDCYMNAVKAVIHANGGDELRLVHGIVTGQGILAGIRFGHAWVEYNLDEPGDEMVFDPSVEGRELWIRRDQYYSIGQIRESEVKRYTQSDTVEALLKNEHWGPWE